MIDGRVDVRPYKLTKRYLGPQPPPCKEGECNTNGFIVGTMFSIYYCTKCGGNVEGL